MDKLEKSLTLMSSGDGTKLDISKLKRVSSSYDFTDDKMFELLAWESTKGSKTYRIELPIEYYDEIVCSIPRLKFKKKEVEDPFKEEVVDESRRNRW